MKRQFTKNEEGIIKDLLHKEKVFLLKQQNEVEEKIENGARPKEKYQALGVEIYTRLLNIVSIEKELEMEEK